MIDIKHVKCVVVDESDEFIKKGLQKDFIELFSLLKKVQIVLTSATINSNLLEFSKKVLKNPISIRIENKDLSLKLITQ